MTPRHLTFGAILLSAAGLCSSCATEAERSLPVAGQLTEAVAPDGRYISWKEHIIDDEAHAGGLPVRGADGLAMADFDKDGHPDVVSVHEDSNHIRMAFGSDDPDVWSLVTLAEGDEAGACEHASAGDLNHDGYPDVIAACEQAHLIYLQNPGRDARTASWKRLIPEMTKNRGSFIKVSLADFNGDGRLEVVAANKGVSARWSPDQKLPKTPISWFALPDDPLDGSGWVEHVLAEVEVPLNAQPVDLDGDGDADILASSRNEFRMFWFENTGGEEIAFRQHAINVEGAGNPVTGGIILTGFNVDFFDFNRDGRLDIATFDGYYNVVWLEQPAEASANWRLHRAGSIAPDHLAGIAVIDINGDTHPDLIAGGYSGDPRPYDGEDVTPEDPVGRIAWFENPGDPAAEWTRHDISRRKRGMFDGFIGRDLDADGDIDIVSTRGNSGEFDGVFWLEQIRSDNPVKRFQPARETESQPLPLAGR